MDKFVDSSGPVKLIVKASNQQFDDQIVECETNWSVLKLKEHLAIVYPSKPLIPDQKLIYHGQLLKDQCILKDILRSYDDIEPSNHILHLVYSPKQQQQQPQFKQMTMEGLRLRNVQRSNLNAANSTATTTESSATASTNQINEREAGDTPTINIPQIITNAANVNCPTSSASFNGYPIAFGNGGVLAQQMAIQNWQQVYAQYINQYMNLISVGVRPETFFMQNQPPSQTGSVGFSGIFPQIPFNQGNLPMSPTIGSQSNLFEQQTNSPQQSQQNTGDTVDNGGGANGDVRAQVIDGEQPAAVQQPAPAPGRFPQIVQEEQDNRDWLDTFYSFSRLMVLLTLVYFYSSPLRCLSVLFIAIAIYMYHIGYFRSGPRETNNNNINNNNNNNINNNNNRQDEGEPQQQQQQPDAALINENADGIVAPSVNNANNEPNVEENNETTTAAVPETTVNNLASVIAFVRTFVVTFFTSLLPETAAL